MFSPVTESLYIKPIILLSLYLMLILGSYQKQYDNIQKS